MKSLKSLCPSLNLATWGIVLSLAGGMASSAESSPQFGFTGPESFPIDTGIAQLRSADLDGDGLMDIVVANNQKARISILLNRTGKPVEAPQIAPGKSDINDLPPDSRFKMESLTSEKRISSMTVADLNGDGLADIAYVGEPKPLELVIHYSLGGMKWSPPKRWQIDDAQLVPDSLAVGDLNGDGLTDIAVLADTYIAVFYQRKDHTFPEPEKVPFTGSVKSLRLEDLNGDGLRDLILTNPENANPVRLRLQSSSGQLGPEIHFNLQPIRALGVEDLDGDKSAEIITIAQNSGRATLANLVRKPANALSGTLAQGQFQVMPLGRSGKARRGLAWADLNGDSLSDLLVAQPEIGQLTVYLQQSNGELGQARAFPSLAGVQEIAVMPGQTGKAADVFLLSADERQIGRTQLNVEGRIGFPTPLSFDGKPLTMAVGVLKAGTPPVLAAIVESADRRQLLLANREGGITHTQMFSATFKANPSGLVFHDIDQDGVMDLVVLIPYEKLKICLQVPGKDFQVLDIAPPGGTMEQPWASAVDVDGDQKPELLLAQKNFLRAVILKKDASGAWVLAVKDQINGSSPTSKIAGAASLKNGTNRIESLFLLDSDRKSLSLCERDGSSVWQTVRNIPLPFSEFTELRTVGIGSATPNCIVCFGNSGVGWLKTDGETWEMMERDGYETLVKEGRLSSVYAGDLNHDGVRDVVFLETSRNHVEIASYSRDRKWVPGNRWQVFEERTFRSRRGEGTEPREALVADFDHDGKVDLAVIVHDRVLLYFQQ